MFKFKSDENYSVLEEFGYKFFPVHSQDKSTKGDWFIGLYQKRVRNPTGTSYFVNIDVYDYSKWEAVPATGYQYEVSIQTEYNRCQDIALNLTFYPQKMTIEQVEYLIEEFFQKFGTDYE